jgi:biotin-dependent carboxylase-like uncharacterized protein
MGNVMLGNDENDAALEVLLTGFEAIFQRDCCIVLAGADLGLRIDGEAAQSWMVHRVRAGGELAVAGPVNHGCRSYLCVSGGIDVPPVMGSRSTFIRAGLGGHRGRALISGDILEICEPKPLWKKASGFVCPRELRPVGCNDEPLFTTDGPQADFFSQKGLETFYGETYMISVESDRTGYRLNGPKVEHICGADIVSDGLVRGAVQIPGNGLPIVMMSDANTSGGYPKIGVVSSWSAARLAQRMPGEPVRFKRVDEETAVGILQRFETNLRRLEEMRAAYRSRPR